MLLYRIAIFLMRFGFWLTAAFGHRKAKAAWRGRKGWRSRLKQADIAAQKQGKTGPWAHFHCASLGEYEQGAPVLQMWREQHPTTPILLTFFSPSGIDGVAEQCADHIDYLPFDTAQSMRAFSEALDISDVVLVKYELWPEMIRSFHRNGTRLHLIAARFDQGRHPLNSWGGLIRKHLGLFTSLQVQDPLSAQALSAFGLKAQVTGDPRVDRVYSATQKRMSGPIQERLERIQQWKGSRNLLVVGSAWPAEWEALQNILEHHQDWAVLWAPHEIDHPHIERWTHLEGTDYLSHWIGQQGEQSQQGVMEDLPETPNMLIANEIGLLRFAYGVADLAVVGGGWGRGVHNVLEPAAFGIPILCGPQVHGFREVEALTQAGALVVCDTAQDLEYNCGIWMASSDRRNTAGSAAAAWVAEQRGAALRITTALKGATGADFRA